jgi:cyclopropane fatty-acyl-phospholipid synthase-like methyltransferase
MSNEELKERQGKMWGSGPFELIEETIADMHDELVSRLGVNRGEAWLDVGCGTAGSRSALRAAARMSSVSTLHLR